MARPRKKPVEQVQVGHPVKIIARRVLLGSGKTAVEGDVVHVTEQARKSLIFTGQAVDA